MGILLIVLPVVLLLLAISLPAQTLDIGPRVGDVFPPFEMKDQHGMTRDLASVLGPNGAIVVLYRSADW